MTWQLWNDLPSSSLEMRTTVEVISPNRPSLGTPPKLLLLLHGLTGNHSQWTTSGNLQWLADQHNLLIALPEGQRSFWVDQAHGLKWGTWVGVELPALLHNQIRLQEQTYIGGLSMGGYGAIRAAFDYPQTFAGAFSLSGTLDIAEEAFHGRHPDLYQIGFGNLDHPRPEDDLIQRSKELKEPLPPLFICCGTDDRLLNQNHLFEATYRNVAGVISADLTSGYGPGAHDFKFWRHWLPIALDTLLYSAGGHKESRHHAFRSHM